MPPRKNGGGAGSCPVESGEGGLEDGPRETWRAGRTEDDRHA